MFPRASIHAIVIIEDFESLLLRAGFTKRELARRLGVHPNTVSNWGGSPPQYAYVYLDLVIRVRGLLDD